ncbi:response regulator transcription factor [Saccharopolyspora shandongensis]|uniref:response regulator transcription factor n=1 Tax=Saccharopolyspora shandongensis TaxID=418495 RepID=UPI0033CE48B1
MIRVLLADDEAMIRAGVRSILATDPEIDVVAEAEDGRQAIDLAAEHRPDVVLLDIRMPRLDGLAAAAELARAQPEVKVVVLTTFDEDEFVARALGDVGVRAVADGAAYLSPRIAQRVIAGMRGGQAARRNAARDRAATLTAREREVLALVGAGLSNQDIARRLFLAEGTVKAHVSTILQRLSANNRVQAAITAYEAGLVDD